jgi:hypothetical protein
MEYVLDPTGVYTDTAEYMEIIPECLNVSIGYDSEHSHFETLNTTHVLALRDAICALDWDAISLVVERDPTKREYREQPNYGSSWGTWTGSEARLPSNLSAYEIPSVERILSTSTRSLAQWVVEADPDDVAMLLQDLADQLEEAHYAMNDYDDSAYNRLNVGMM